MAGCRHPDFDPGYLSSTPDDEMTNRERLKVKKRAWTFPKQPKPSQTTPNHPQTT